MKLKYFMLHVDDRKEKPKICTQKALFVEIKLQGDYRKILSTSSTVSLI